jgi:acetyl esterase/lipase
VTLDDAYAIAAHTPDWESFPPRWTQASQAFREGLGARAEIGVGYGPSVRQVYDLFHPAGPSQGTVVFIHGGYWKAFDRSYWSYLAAGPLMRNRAVAMLGYDLCPDVRISEITRQVTSALTAIAARTTGPIALIGHSAGGHLVARMLAPGNLPEPVRERVTRTVPIAPLADLEPLLQTTMNDTLGLDAAEAKAESPLRQAKPAGVAVTVWVGADERPALLDQARRLADAWQANMVTVPGKHHFDIIDALADPGSAMVSALLD